MNDDKRPNPSEDPDIQEYWKSHQNHIQPVEPQGGYSRQPVDSAFGGYTDASSYGDPTEFEDDGGVLNSFSERDAYEQRKTLDSHRETQPGGDHARLEKEQIRAEKKRRKKKAKKNGCLFKMVWLVMVLLVSVVLAQYILVGANDMLAVNRAEGTVNINIPADSNIDQVADILHENGVVNSPNFFKFYMKMTKKGITFTKGDYENMNTNMDYEAIVNFLLTQSNRTDVVKVTFPEGTNVQGFAEILEENGVCGKEEFLEACNSSDFDEDYPFIAGISNPSERYYKLEGYLFPDTYDFYQDSKPQTVIEKFLANFRNKILEPTIKQDDGTEISVADHAQQILGLSLDELVNLSSLVQAEGRDEDDMKVIACVFLNRLNPDLNEGVLQLGSDPTVFYPYPNRETAPEGFQSRYNTYEVIGLPPGAIDNPGMMAINAVLDPNSNYDYLYFCHAADGTPYYAVTAEGHHQNQIEAGIISPDAE